MKTRNKRIWWGIFVIVLLATGYFALRYYRAKKEDPYHTFLKPRVELTRFVVKELTRETADMDMQILIDNPLPVSVKIDSLQYKFFIGGVEVVKSKYPKNISLKSNDSSLIVIPVFVKYKLLEEVLIKLDKEKVDSVDYTVSGSVLLSFLSFKNKQHDFSFTRREPLFIIPELVVEKIKFEKFGLRKSKILTKVTIENRNAMAFDFKQTHYKIKMDNDQLAAGELEQTIHIPAKGKATIEMVSEVSLMEGMETMFDYLLNAAGTEYSIYFDTKIVSDNKAIKDSKIIMEATGKLKDMKK